MKFIKSIKSVFFGFLLIVVCINVQKADDKPKYSVSEIPPDLMIDADAVVRNNSVVFRVKDEDDAVNYCTIAITILNKDGQHFGNLHLSYNDFFEIDDIEAALYDKNGQKIRKLDEDDFRDNASISWAKLYSDWRYKAAELYHNQFPYTVEFTYKLEYKGYLNWPIWNPEKEDAAIQYSSYEVILPHDYELRYRCYNWYQKPVVSIKSKDNVSYFWDVVNLPPFKSEPYGPPLADQYKTVITAPVQFKMDDYEGNLATWQNYGLWYQKLWEGRQELPSSVVKELSTVLTPEMDRDQKICALYHYLQSKTRYVDLNAGIGGWQPVEAEKVSECGYGDCKALSNYMLALLNAAGIPAYPVLINAASKATRLEESFPRNQFNHVIVCVPGEIDSVWLECTNQTAPCGFLNFFTEDRYGLLITENGGTLVKTPSSRMKNNKKITKAYVDIENKEADITIEYSGNLAALANEVYHNQSTESYEDWVKNELDIPSVKVLDKSIQQIEEDTLITKLNAHVSIPNFFSLMGSRLFFSPSLISKEVGIPKDIEERKYPVVLSFPYCIIDSIKYKMTPGSIVEALPDDINISTDYYSFTTKSTMVDSSTLMYVRSLELKTVEMPSEGYAPFREFLQSMVKGDSRKIVLNTN